MSDDVIFEEEDDDFQIPIKKPEPKEEDNSLLVRWLLNRGVAKSSKGANAILITVAIIAFALSFFFFAMGGDIRTLFELGKGPIKAESFFE